MAKKHVAVSLRKPPSPEKLDAFVTGGAEAQSVNPSSRRRRRAPVAPTVVARAVVEPVSADAAVSAVASSPEAAAELEAVTAAKPETVAAAVLSSETLTAAEPEAVTAAKPETVAAAVLEAATPVELQGALAPEAAAPLETAEKPEAAVNPVAEATMAASAEVWAASVEGTAVGVVGAGMTPFSVVLPQPLAERLAMHCIAQGYDVSQVIGEALDQHLSRRLGGGERRDEGAPEGTAGAGFRWEEPRKWADAFRWEEPRKWADAFRQGSRVEQVLLVGRALVGLWQKRPWAA
ncbi:hypothetical protein [Chondromyces apiculatus]|uniref:Uncharacterized protein n=1 Tax=Chondromyces apiculatus DSM 436 TaxID=1192034 RepID=A0A017T5L8_9BACT|nr:hypothetical protein [Chondromyces apiculatus]EYF04080.1 Hypothetical protein CAP_4954 [Chondromyces apiculatus DSM 436]